MRREHIDGWNMRKIKGIVAVSLGLATSVLADEDVGGAKALARRFVADRDKGGMAAVIGDIEDCYHKAAPRGHAALRRCMVFDMIGFSVDNTMSKIAPGVGGLPYWEERTVSARLGHYGPVAKFKNAQEAMEFIKPRANAAEAEIVRIQQSRGWK